MIEALPQVRVVRSRPVRNPPDASLKELAAGALLSESYCLANNPFAALKRNSWVHPTGNIQHRANRITRGKAKHDNTAQRSSLCQRRKVRVVARARTHRDSQIVRKRHRREESSHRESRTNHVPLPGGHRLNRLPKLPGEAIIAVARKAAQISRAASTATGNHSQFCHASARRLRKAASARSQRGTRCGQPLAICAASEKWAPTLAQLFLAPIVCSFLLFICRIESLHDSFPAPSTFSK